MSTIIKSEDWMQKKWRPAMGWMYMLVCFCDMILFPIAWSILQALLKQPVTQWNPLTLQGAGLFHLAMGAVLGIAAWGRTQEKVAGASTQPTSLEPTFPAVRQPIPGMGMGIPTPPMARNEFRPAQNPSLFTMNEFLPGQSPKFTDD